MINTNKPQYKVLFHPPCMCHNIRLPVISNGISTEVEQFADIKCYETMVKFFLCLINLYETDLKTNCIFWQPEFFWFSVDIYTDTKQTHSIQHIRTFSSMFWRPAYGFIGQQRLNISTKHMLLVTSYTEYCRVGGIIGHYAAMSFCSMASSLEKISLFICKLKIMSVVFSFWTFSKIINLQTLLHKYRFVIWI